MLRKQLLKMSNGISSVTSLKNIVYMKYKISWAFVHVSKTGLFSATVEVQKNKKPLSHSTLFFREQRWGFSTSQ